MAFWHYLCVARMDGLESARENLIEVAGEERVPMSELYKLFKGEGSEADVWLAVEEEDPDKDARARRAGHGYRCALRCRRRRYHAADD